LAKKRSALTEALQVLLMGPREWGPIFRIKKLWRVELCYWLFYTFRFMPLDIMMQAARLDRPFSDFKYGDTPWFTSYDILKEAGVCPQDKLFDLGSGRGKVVFMGNLGFGCEATGVELLPVYTKIGRRIVKTLGTDSISFWQKDFLNVDISTASVVYACAAAMASETLEDLLLLVNQLSPGARWISVGWKSEHEQLKLTEEKEYFFSWGWATVYFYEVREGGPDPAREIEALDEDTAG
jgi:hypothetical protein